MKLKESIPSNSVKIIELYNKIDSGMLDTSPDFQRKLVWKKQHKYHFIETILLNYPFPEIYIASSDIDVETLKSKEIVVDGKQRLTTIVDYIKGINDFEKQIRVLPFEKLSTDEKKDFLNYLVTVKDLKDLKKELITEIFQRINSTEYSLNSIEKTNAEYGDGEFAVFCKQIIDSSYNPTEEMTDIILNKDVKLKLNSFFSQNNIFSDNDISRMYDNQYVMLIVSTMLEGAYFSRSIKIKDYLKKYNNSFELYQKPLEELEKAIDVISRLGISERSYWFNQANLFTLIIELSKVNTSTLDLEKFELALLAMENKVSNYFNEEDLDNISADERKYFEVARQGSHEKAARIHRGTVISNIIKFCLDYSDAPEEVSFLDRRFDILNKKNIRYVTIEPTQTGLEKGIIDATIPIRNFFKEIGLHKYEDQGYGQEHKKIIDGVFILKDSTQNVKLSLYRANGRGDARIWITGLPDYSNPNDTIAIIFKENNLYIINLSQLEIEDLDGLMNPFSKLIV